MSRLEQMRTIHAPLIRKLMKSSKAIGSAVEYGLSRQRTMSSLKAQRRRRLSTMFWQYWTKEGRKTSRP